MNKEKSNKREKPVTTTQLILINSTKEDQLLV